MVIRIECMSRFEHKCDMCGQGREMFTLEGQCPICKHDSCTYVEKNRLEIPKIEKMGIKELLDN